ncbi:MAG: M43 family zinc metalloprotease [Chitinophagales bacterium]|nr:M43 family zinc metalloprotease [Chitinophagales bacterium]
MQFKSLFVGAAILIASHSVSAQVNRCNTTEKYQELLAKDPTVADKKAQVIQLAKNYAASQGANKSQRALLVVPVVVHVMHTGEAVGTGKNISDAQILSQIEVLNEDYQFRNADTASIPAVHRPVAGNVGFEFRLATVDPDGNPTNGIDRVNMGSGATWSDSWKDQTSWDNQSYLNIWVADIGNSLLGYATFPNTTSPTQDGVAIHYRYFGRAPQNPFNSDFDLGRTATHEVGHYFALEHTFQGACGGNTANNCGNGGDGICDTPPTSAANYGCNLSITRNTCTETPADKPDQWMNYMDYMDDACLFMFTAEQADVMNGVLNSSRDGLLSSPAAQSQNFFSYGGQVVNAVTNAPVANAKVAFFNGNAKVEYTTDANGNFTTPSFREGTYTVYAGKWGYGTTEYVQNTLIDSNSSGFTIPIQPNIYYDDFTFDYGWSVATTASSGEWVQGRPVGTDYQGEEANPGADVSNDFTGFALVTGNGGGQAGNDDVDNGEANLFSPTFDLSNYNEPYLSYYPWFFNGGGQGDPLNDTLSISITNGIDTVLIETLAGTGNNVWAYRNYKLKDLINPTATMRLLVSVDDEGGGHIVEAGFDKFQVVDSLPDTISSVSQIERNLFNVYPNPTKGSVTIKLDPSITGEVVVELLDVSGRQLQTNQLQVQGNGHVQLNLSQQAAGIYLVRVQSASGTAIRRLVVTQ